ncbi:ATP-binding cassette domain-containing protein [Catellatospora coxensis]
MTGESALRFSGLGKRYGRRAWALRDCTLDLPQGNVIGLVGANGAGKTTLLQLAIGLLEPTEGTVSMFGRPLRMDSPPGWPRSASWPRTTRSTGASASPTCCATAGP